MVRKSGHVQANCRTNARVAIAFATWALNAGSVGNPGNPGNPGSAIGAVSNFSAVYGI